MKVRDVLRRIRDDGWILVKSRGGSHRQFKHPTKRGRVTIAGHDNDDLQRDTLKSIWRQAQLEEKLL